MWILLLLILAVFSYMDIKSKTLPTGAVGAILLLSIAVAARRTLAGGDIGMVLAAMLPGLLLTTMAFAMKEKLGYGDGLVLIIIGNLTGIRYCLLILLYALMLSFVFSCGLLMIFRKRGKDCFPFVPFYFCGTVFVLWIYGG